MNKNEISRIEDPVIREIRMKYWNLRHNVFLDERGIPDSEISMVYNELFAKEECEIDMYMNKIKKNEKM